MFVAHREYLAALAAATAIAAGLAGPLAYTLDTVGTAKQGSIISAGPRVDGEFGPGGPPGGGRHGRGGMPMPPGMGQGGMGQGGMGQGTPGRGGPGGDGGYRGMGGFGGPGGLLNGTRPSAEMIEYLTRDAGDFTWMAAAVGSNTASGYQLDTGYSVMPIGGFNGTDPSPTLDEFQKLVADKEIHFFIAGGGFGSRDSGEDRPSAQIAAWVTESFTSKTIDGVTVYDLTSPKG